MKPTTEAEGTAPTFNMRVLGAGSGENPHPWPENQDSERGGALRESPRKGSEQFGAGKPGPIPRAGPRTKTGPSGLTMAGGAVPSRQRVVALQPDPGWAITWGRGEGTPAAAAAELALRSLSPAPPRASYINRRGTMSPNFVVGI